MREEVVHSKVVLDGDAAGGSLLELTLPELADLPLESGDAPLLLLEPVLVHQQRPPVFLTGPDEALGEGLLLQLSDAGRGH